jgi:hypothetical protein
MQFGPAWSEINRFRVSGQAVVADCCEVFGSLAVDNVTVNVVPLPAAVWLFGSALAGLGWIRRKQSV